MAYSIGKFSAKLMYLYPALSNVIKTVWQYTGFALNMPIENAINWSGLTSPHIWHFFDSRK